jgi:hypothetical protein
MYENEAKSNQWGWNYFVQEFKAVCHLVLKTEEDNTTNDATILTNYLEQWFFVVNEILDEQIPFEEKFKRKNFAKIS